MMTHAMRRGWQALTLLLLLICAFTAVHSVALSLTDRLGPGPGFFPFWLSLLGALLSLLIFVQVTRAGSSGDAAPLLPRGAALHSIALILAGLAGAALLIEPLGFRLAMFLFNASLLYALGERRWWAVALFALIGSVFLFHVFDRWLDVPLPVGLLGV